MITRMEWATAMIARLSPRRAARRWYWALRYVSLVRTAPRAACTNAERSQRLPRVVRPLLRLPALMLLPGLTPAHEARWAAVGKRVISKPYGDTLRYLLTGFAASVGEVWVIDSFGLTDSYHFLADTGVIFLPEVNNIHLYSLKIRVAV